MDWLKETLTNYQLIAGVVIAVFIGSAAAGAAGTIPSYQDSKRHAGTVSTPVAMERLYTNSATQYQGEYNFRWSKSVGTPDPSQAAFPSPGPVTVPAPQPAQQIEPINRCVHDFLDGAPCIYYCPDGVNISSDSVCHPCTTNTVTDVVCANEDTR